NKLKDELSNDLDLSNLKELKLNGSNITVNSLAHLLAKASKLETLDLTNCKNLSGELLNDLDLSNLKELKLNGSNITVNSLVRLLAKANKLEKLDLTDCNNLIGELPNDLDLSSLKEVKLRESKITYNINSIGRLLANASKLETLDLSNQYLRGELLNKPNLSNLKELKVNDTDITISSLGLLLANASKLEKLDLTDCKKLMSELPNDLDLSNLKDFQVNNSNLTVNSLGRLLANASKLEKLVLFHCKNLSGKILNNPNLSNLKVLMVNDTDITINSLGLLLAKASKLEKLNLKDCTNLNGELPNELSLSNLKTLELQDSFIPTKSLGAILAQTPNLKTLKLDCIYLDEDDDFPNDLHLDMLEELNLGSEAIPDSILEKIKAAAPSTLKIINPQKTYRPKVSHSLSQFTSKKEISNQSLKEKESIIDQFHSLQKEKNITSNKPHEFQKQNPSSLSRNKPELWDADTTFDPKKTLNTTQIFYGGGKEQEVNHYRLDIAHTVTMNPEPCSIKHAFLLHNEDQDLKLEQRKIPVSEQDLYPKIESQNDHFYGKQSLKLTQDWQPLASLSPQEEMLSYHLNHPAAVEIQYSKRDNLYYIRSTQEKLVSVDIDFIVKVPKPVEENELPKEIWEKIEKYRKFEAKPLEIDEKQKGNQKGSDYFNALKKQHVGACRHRAVVFKASMEKKGHQARIVSNDCHAFVEVFYKEKEQWVRCDLGGYEAKLQIHQPHNPRKDEEKLEKKAEPELLQLTTEGTVKPQQELVEHLSIDVPEKLIQPPKKTWFAKPKPLSKESDTWRYNYIGHLLAEPGANKLVQFKDSQSIAGFRHHLQYYCKHTKRPCFYIHSKEDLVCSAPFVARDDKGIGTIKDGPGGPLHDFLTKHQNDERSPIIMVNYDAFSAQDIVRFNALLDGERKADGTPLPKKAQVIGLLNPDKPGAYQGQDFSSRFDQRTECPLKEEQLVIPPILQEKQDLQQLPKKTVQLYGGFDWEERLLGKWVIQGTQLVFKEGKLLKAFQKGNTHIELANAPWDNPEFLRFWQEANLYGHIQVQGKSYPLPKELELSRHDGHGFAHVKDIITELSSDTQPAKDSLPLNPGLFPRFLAQYECDNESKTLHYQPGWLKNNRDKSLNIYLSAPLESNMWALFLDVCKKNNIKVHLTVAPGVGLPADLGLELPQQTSLHTPPFFANTSLPHTLCIESTDVDVTLSQLQEKEPLIIDVSEVNSSDLLNKLDGKFNKANLSFSFSKEPSVLLKELQNGRTVVLKGVIQPELRDALSEVMLQRAQQEHTAGRLLVISEQQALFPMSASYRHSVTIEEKKQALGETLLSNSILEQYPLCQLKAISKHLKLNPKDTPEQAWEGLESLPEIQSSQRTHINLDNSEQQADEFNQQRFDAVSKILEESPFVFLAGRTGVGKTTFIHEVWQEQHPNLHFGERNIEAWAKDDNKGIKTLFLDEANISARHWSAFEGLFQDPPGILIGNQWHPLSKEHKVIFAGNPLAYGGERQLPSLFARHGNCVIFDPMTPAYLYEKVLKSAFADILNSKDLSLPILQVAAFLAQSSSQEELITPRELGMMALLTKRYCLDYPNENPLEAAKYYAYTLAKPHVPEHLSTQFDALFKAEQSISRSEDKKPQHFTLTPSNQPAIDALNDFLNLRSLRQEGKTPSQGGLGGVILEGEPGIGKTELVAKTLVAHGLERKKIGSDSKQPGFYIMPVSMPLSEKENLLRKAFHEGSIVVIDEINSAPMMEELLNELLDPKKNNAAENPGFMVIGTQNPSTMAGRRRASRALEHRLLTVKLPEYTSDEILLILKNKGLPEAIGQSMLHEYLQLRKEAEKNNQLPLCFRDLLKRAELYLESEEYRMSQHIEVPKEKPLPLIIEENPIQSDQDKKKDKEEEEQERIKKVLQDKNLMAELFQFDVNKAPNQERIKLMLFLENQKEPKYIELINECYQNYTSVFQTQINTDNKSQLLAIAQELKQIHVKPEKIEKSSVSIIVEELKNRSSKYLNSFWITSHRRTSAKNLQKQILEKKTHRDILNVIVETRNEVLLNDAIKETGMHSKGKSRYYEALNELEKMLVTAWINDPEAVQGFADYIEVFTKERDDAFSRYIKALKFYDSNKYGHLSEIISEHNGNLFECIEYKFIFF
ncbi:MAG: hypothetical protein HYX60_01765, partial [Legionella longbeachae]|nr:hypothetical protein [Legionella longbeachae]